MKSSIQSCFSRAAGRLLLLVGSAPCLLAQTVAKSAPAAIEKTLLQELNLPAIWFLLACSLVVVWLVVDLYLKSGHKRLLPTADLEVIRGHFRRGDYQGAMDFCCAHAGPLCDAVGAALKYGPGGQRAAEDAVVVSLGGANTRFQTKIAYLSVIGVIAPMVGLTGTVLGMIDAFALMGQAGAADPSKLSGAIGHVLHATAGGLIVAIPAFVFYYLLRSRVGHGFHEIGATVAELFRNFHYADFAGHSFRGAEPCAAKPQWKNEHSIQVAQGT